EWSERRYESGAWLSSFGIVAECHANQLRIDIGERREPRPSSNGINPLSLLETLSGNLRPLPGIFHLVEPSIKLRHSFVPSCSECAVAQQEGGNRPVARFARWKLRQPFLDGLRVFVGPGA